MNKQIEERLELTEVIDYAMRDWDNYIDECLEEEIQPIDTFEEYIADAVLDAGYRKYIEAEWVFKFTLADDDFYECSVCGEQVIVNCLCKERSPVKHYPYCHCGAKMKGGE